MAAPASAHPADAAAVALLQLELGGHAGPIRRIAVDPRRQLVVTGSDDHSARSWSLANGQAQRVFWPAPGSADEGRVYGVALHPQRPWLATGGTAGRQGGQGIDLHELQSGQRLRRIGDLAGEVKRLLWTPDGQLLVAAHAGANGISAFDERGTPVFSDAFDSAVYALAAAPGRLAAAGLDGTLRLYRVDGARITLHAQHRLPGRPASLAFSPDGQALVVGHFLAGRAPDILEWDSGAVHALPAPPGLAQENLMSVAWSGRAIVAAGSSGFSQRRVPLLRYDAAGRRLVAQGVAATSSVTDLVALPDGGVAYAAADGTWGRWAADADEVQRLHTALLPDLTGASHLRVSADGRRLSWTLDGGANRVLFDLDRFTLVRGAGADLPAPQVRRGLFNATRGWEDQASPATPVIDGRPFVLQADEVSRAVALGPADMAVLGTSRALHRFGADGRLLWRSATNTEVRAVHIARQGALVASAMLDGTVRLWHGGSGRELLSLLVLRDGRWIAWTPSGYYHASPGAERLMGWRVDPGNGIAPHFHPAAQFRAQYHRPDLIEQLLDTLDETQALARAGGGVGGGTGNGTGSGMAGTGAAARVQAEGAAPVLRRLPPVVELASAADLRTADTRLALRVRLQAPADAPVSRITVRVNGQLAGLTKPPAGGDPQGGERELAVDIPAQDALVQVFAENRHGVSEPASLRVTWAGPPAAPDDAQPAPRATLYLLAIGISAYRSVDPLMFAAKDAQDFAAAMRRQHGLLYDRVEIKLLTDEQATRDGIANGLDWLRRQVTRRDVGMLFISGHGVVNGEHGYAFLPVDANPAQLAATGVAGQQIKQALAGLPGKAVLFIDTCHAGNVWGDARRKSLRDMSGVINELASAENGTVVFSSSTGRQLSIENAQWRNGAFTKALVEGLDGGADADGSGRVTHKALDYFVSQRVRQLTEGEQSPVSLSGGVPDFPLAVVHAAGRPPERPPTGLPAPLPAADPR